MSKNRFYVSSNMVKDLKQSYNYLDTPDNPTMFLPEEAMMCSDIYEELQKNRDLKVIKADRVGLNGDVLIWFLDILLVLNIKVESIILSNNKIGVEIIEFVKNMKYLSNVTELQVHNNNISGNSIIFSEEILNCSLIKLNMVNNNLTNPCQNQVQEIFEKYNSDIRDSIYESLSNQLPLDLIEEFILLFGEGIDYNV